MFRVCKPSDAQIRDFLTRQADEPFSYDMVGCTRDDPRIRRGWNIDTSRVLLGHGAPVFQRARQAIERWQMFPPEIATLCWPDLPCEGRIVAVLYWAAPVRLWLLFATRIVYAMNETALRDGRQIERFGFAYGTLPNHPERGEERFLVEWDRSDDSVWYDLVAVSQPAHWLARLGYPYTRYEQARFRRLSGAAMQRAIKGVSDD
jgi:uncharacterized protein (UPF0548 family)